MFTRGESQVLAIMLLAIPSYNLNPLWKGYSNVYIYKVFPTTICSIVDSPKFEFYIWYEHFIWSKYMNRQEKNMAN